MTKQEELQRLQTFRFGQAKLRIPMVQPLKEYVRVTLPLCLTFTVKICLFPNILNLELIRRL